MKLTFLKSHQSAMTGNELYHVGDQADLENGEWLVQQDIARPGWHTIRQAQPEQSGANLSDMTVVELQGLAREYNVPYAGLRKSELIEALEMVM